MKLHEARRRLKAALSAVALSLLAAGCATPPQDPAALADFKAMNDPLEPMNRGIFKFNEYLDRYFIKPVAIGYLHVFPGFVRDSIRDFLHNLNEPVIFANDMMQADFPDANLAAGRFVINSTFGLGGLIDTASRTGVGDPTGDFGQTLYSWGVPDGPYLVLPVFGPSDPRDAVGMGVDGVMDPFGYLAGDYGAGDSATIARMAAQGVDLRSRNIDTLDEVQKDAIDYYAELRSLYRQHRADELRHGRPGPLPNVNTTDEPHP